MGPGLGAGGRRQACFTVRLYILSADSSGPKSSGLLGRPAEPPGLILAGPFPPRRILQFSPKEYHLANPNHSTYWCLPVLLLMDLGLGRQRVHPLKIALLLRPLNRSMPTHSRPAPVRCASFQYNDMPYRHPGKLPLTPR